MGEDVTVQYLIIEIDRILAYIFDTWHYQEIK